MTEYAGFYKKFDTSPSDADTAPHIGCIMSSEGKVLMVKELNEPNAVGGISTGISEGSIAYADVISGHLTIDNEGITTNEKECISIKQILEMIPGTK